MEVYPAIDLKEGKVVRLERGDYARVTVYSDDPVEVAQKWQREGARWIHVVDLDGAKTGMIQNWDALRKLASSVEASLQFGGGVRTQGDIEELSRLGIQRIILGTKALDPAFLNKMTESPRHRIAASLDLRGEEVWIEGWSEKARRSVFELFRELKPYHLDCVIVTDIERDGTLAGLNLEKIGRLLKSCPFGMIVSGGVKVLDDIQNLLSLHSKQLKGVILGKALYEGSLNLREAVNLTQESEGRE